MATPVEFRHFLRKFTLEDLKSGIQPIRQQLGPMVNGQAPIGLYAPPAFQFRYKEKLHVDGAAKLEWSEWLDIPFVREGDEDRPILPATA